MKFLIIAMVLFFCACGSQSEKKVSVNGGGAQLADSLNSAVDSIAGARNMHSKNAGMHLHKPGDNLATVAHQDPERDRMIRANIAKNRMRELTIHEQQMEAMAEIARKNREKAQSGVL